MKKGNSFTRWLCVASGFQKLKWHWTLIFCLTFFSVKVILYERYGKLLWNLEHIMHMGTTVKKVVGINTPGCHIVLHQI